MNTALSPKTTCFNQHIRQKSYVSLRVFAENTYFHFFSECSVYCRKHTVLFLVFANINMFNSAFLSKTQSLTPLFHQKRSKRSENAQLRRQRKIFNSVFLATTLSYAMRLRQKLGGIENFIDLAEFEEDFRKSEFYCVLYL